MENVLAMFPAGGGGDSELGMSGTGAAASPDRSDAMIWAMTALAVKPPRAPPRVVGL